MARSTRVASRWQLGRVSQQSHYFHCQYLIMPLFIFAASTVSSQAAAGMGRGDRGLCRVRLESCSEQAALRAAGGMDSRVRVQ